MLPYNKFKEIEHRKQKRKVEISLVTEEISNLIRSDPDFVNENIRILELGSGSGFQISYLKGIGNVIASDIYINENIRNSPDFNFVSCSIENTPFYDAKFDIIFSNHVIEHIKDLEYAFNEIKRIGKARCIYAFTVPTNLWLLLSIPAQYYNKLRYIFNKGLSRIYNRNILKNKQNFDALKKQNEYTIFNKFVRMVLPGVHGECSNFIECYCKFKIKNWKRMFSDYGFKLIKKKPLLLYGPSEWPIIQTTHCKNNFCSSVLFILKVNNNK
jgi:ubiquinone/menaquinone biosynthesis C-methylase UbiE